MNSSINSGSLFHFTKKMDVFKSILVSGLRFSYAFEPLWGETEDRGNGIPMISFCDIPLMRMTKHTRKYGKFAIGFYKKRLLKHNPDIAPILYVNSAPLKEVVSDVSKYDGMDDLSQLISSIPIDVSKRDKYITNGFEKITRKQRDAQFLIGVSKPYEGKNSKGKFECYHDEREWRIILPKVNTTGVMSRADFELVREDWNNAMIEGNHYLITPKYELGRIISHIIIEKEAQRQGIINVICKSESIFGKHNISEKDKIMLISKISSMEQIKADY